MNKKVVVLIIIAALFSFSYFAYAGTNAACPHGVKICNVKYECGANDGVCPTTYGSSSCTACGACCDPNCGSCTCSGYCVNSIKYNGTCNGGNCGGTVDKDCNNLDCTRGFLCSGVGTSSISVSGDDYTCAAAACSSSVKKTCSGPWTCDATNECSTQLCSGTTYKCYYGTSYKWATSNTEGTCTDDHDNDCNGECDYDGTCDKVMTHGDSACPVSVTAVRVSDTTPNENEIISAWCAASVSNIRSVDAYLDENSNGVYTDDEKCIFIAWEGMEAKFDCNSGAGSTCRNVKCSINTTKSYKAGNDQIMQICPIETQCSTYLTKQDCNDDPFDRCEWCSHCESGGTKKGEKSETCVTKGSCEYYCWKGECLAVCDETNGGCEEITRCDEGINYTKSGSCDQNCGCGYGPEEPNTCIVSHATCGAQCGVNSDCGLPNITGTDCYYNHVCNPDTSLCTCSHSTEYCPVAGTIDSDYCYYGSRICDNAQGCNLDRCLMEIGDFCDPVVGCVKIPPENIRVDINVDMYEGGCDGFFKKLINTGTLVDGDEQYACVHAAVYRTDVQPEQLLYKCTNSGATKCTVNSIMIDPTTRPVDYLEKHQWTQDANTVIIDGKVVWSMKLVRGEDSDIVVTVTDDGSGTAGSGSSTFGFSGAGETLETTIWYPDMVNYVVPPTATGEPNFTLGMTVKMYAQFNKVGLLNYICQDPDCWAFFGVNAMATQNMTWDPYQKAFLVEYDTHLIGTDGCNQFHHINVNGTDGTIYNETQSAFFLSCDPRVTTDPVERRTVLDASDVDAFNLCMWNPMGAKSYSVALSTVNPDQVFMLNMLKLECTDPAKCQAGLDSFNFTLGDLDYACGRITLTKAARSGTYPFLFTSTDVTDPQAVFNTIGTVMIFSESLIEFAAVYIIAIMLVAAMAWGYSRTVPTQSKKTKKSVKRPKTSKKKRR